MMMIKRKNGYDISVLKQRLLHNLLRRFCKVCIQKSVFRIQNRNLFASHLLSTF